MTEPLDSPQTPLSEENEKALQQLAWAIKTSVRQFKLILARCNYASLRTRLVERLREICQVEIHILVIKESEKTLYSAIRAELSEELPACLMVLGLESVQNLEQMLISANQVREQFRNNFSFPFVLWIDEQVHKRLMQFAPDLESWATTRNFIIAKQELANFILQIAEQFFTNTLTLSPDDYLVLESELEAAQKELLTQESSLELEANLESLLGLTKQVNNKIALAINHYQKSLELWQRSNSLEQQGQILSKVAFCYYIKAFKNQEINHYSWQDTLDYVRKYIKFIADNQRLELISDLIVKFGDFIYELPECQQLKTLSEQALELHKSENKPVDLARNYGFLAEVAITQKHWDEVNQFAQKALDVLAAISSWESPPVSEALFLASQELIKTRDVTLYRFLQGQAQYHLGQHQEAIRNLEAARDVGKPQANLRLYLNIINLLQRLYFEQKEYLKAYKTKLQQRSVEQQFGLRAFIGAGRLRAFVETRNFPSLQENIAPEITASGRQLDVKRLIERIGRPDYKLIVIHGQSGVGKSSLVNAGIVPALKQKAIGFQDNLVVAMRVYTNWMEELEKLLTEALSPTPKTPSLSSPHTPPPTPHTLILKHLQQCESRNLRPVLIFDQFEEFFFINSEPAQRQQFFEFLGECLKILPVKIVLSLREDYLHYLLKCNRLTSMGIINNDILSKNVLYELGNFSPADAKAIIQQLTEASSFHLEPALIDELVKDLAGDLGEVRPIELQVVGAQLQTEEITTLVKYRECGTKEELVKRYLQEVVNDCGEENQQAAELVLYLLTDEKGTRPLKTRAELEQDLQQFFSAYSTVETRVIPSVQKLDLVLEIFVKSGLVLLLPENPAERYQLVHDYLAAFIRQQQEPKLTQVMAELEKVRKQRKLILTVSLVGSIAAGLVLAVLTVTARNSAQQAQINEIEALTNSSEAFFASGRTLDALIEALKAEEKLREANLVSADIHTLTTTALQQAVYLQPQEYSFRERNRLEGHSSAVTSVSFSADGKTLASGSSDNTIKLWDMATGKLLKTLPGHSNRVWSVSFSADGKTLASGNDDNTIKLWDVATGKLLKTLPGHSNSVWSVSFSADGKTLASGSDDNTIKLWDVATGKLLKTLPGHSSYVLSVSFSADGKTLASGSDDNTIKLWDVATGKLLKTLPGHSNLVRSVSFSADGKTLASGSYDNTIKLWDVATGKLLKTLSGHSNLVRSVSFSADGKTLASGSNDNTIKLWDVATGKLLKTLSGHTSYVLSVSFSADGKTLASGSNDNTIKLWDVGTGKLLKTPSEHSSSVLSVSFSADGKTLASGSNDNTIKLWEVGTGKLLKTLSGHSSSVTSVSFIADGKTLASGSTDNTIKLWKVAMGKPKTLSGHSDAVWSVSFSADGKTLASGSNDNTIKLWDVATGKLIKTLTKHSDAVWSVSFSADGKTLASGSNDNTIKLWDVTTGKLIKTLSGHGHSSSVWSVSFSADGKTLASGSDDNTIKLWEVGTGKLLKTLSGHSSYVNSVSFSADGKTLASGSDDNTIKLWEVGTGKLLKTLSGHSNSVLSVSFSADGKTLASGSTDNTVILWNFDLDNLVKDGCDWLNSYLPIHPEVLEELKECQTRSILVQAAPALVARGEQLARDGDIDAAVDKFRKALKWNPNLKFDPKAKAQEFANKRHAKPSFVTGRSYGVTGRSYGGAGR